MSYRYLSLFSGIEAATVAWEPLGWEAVAFSEIDPFPSAVLAQMFPNVPNLGDITKIDWSEYRGAVDVVVGGSPCQSFSIAGKREGLKGESGLMFEYIRAVREILPRYFVWENVPGALSCEKGAAFGQLLSEMDDLGYGLAWRVLDAQFFGVSQRRRRVFLVGCLGDAGRAAEILFEPESLRWDSPSSREKRKELAASAERGVGGSGGEGNCLTPWDCQSKRIYSPDGVWPTLYAAEKGAGRNQSVFYQQGSVGSYCLQGNMIGRTDENGPQGDGINEDVAFTLNTADRHAVVAPKNVAKAYAFSAGQSAKAGSLGFQDEQSPTLRGGASGTNQVPTVMYEKAYTQNENVDTLVYNPRQITSPTNGNVPKWNDPCHCIAATDGAPEVILREKAYTLKIRGGCEGGGKGPLIQEDVSATLATNQDQTLFQPVVMDTLVARGPHALMCMASGKANAEIEQDMAPAQAARQYKDPQIVTNGYVVRKLTPRECERLQGFPDDWTKIPYRGKSAEDCPDAPRYKALGNSMAVPVMRWIGERIQAVDDIAST